MTSSRALLAPRLRNLTNSAGSAAPSQVGQVRPVAVRPTRTKTEFIAAEVDLNRASFAEEFQMPLRISVADGFWICCWITRFIAPGGEPRTVTLGCQALAKASSKYSFGAPSPW